MHEIRIETLTPWIELLCEAGDARARDRLLLEGVLALGFGEAAAIWRRSAGGSWSEHVARGPAERLPREGDVEAIAERRMPSDFLPGRRVHVHGSVALALGGAAEDRDPFDLAAALLTTYALVDAGSPAESWPAPLPVRPAEPGRPAQAPGSEEARRVHHDLRNALTSLRATEDLLERFADGLSAAESQRFQSSVERECARAGALLAQGLSAQGLCALPDGEAAGADASAGNPLSSRTAGAVEIVEQVLEAERAGCAAAGVEVRALIDPHARAATCAIAPADLGRIVQNLLVNARQALTADRPATADPQHAGKVGCIWVTLEPSDPARARHLVLVVEDDGPGIGAGDLERVFEPGFSTRGGANSGRGLAIVRSLVQAAGGSVHAELRALGGARLRIHLPLVRGDGASIGSDP